MSNNTKSKKPTHFVSLKDLAKVTTKNLILDNPITNTSKAGHSWVTSAGHYKAGGEKADFLFEGPAQVIFGFNGKWAMNTPQEGQTMDTIKGLQIGYPLNSQETLKEPTEEEAVFKSFLKNVLWQHCWDCMQKFDDKELIDGPASNSCASALKRGKPESAMKPIFAFPNIENVKTKTKTPDTSKAEKMYVELVTMGEGVKMKCLTNIYGPGDKLVSYLKYMTTPDNLVIGTIQPVFRWIGTFWGAHGTTSCGGSVKIELVECNFTPRNAPKLTYGRMLSANTNVEEVDDDGEEGDSSFVHPTGSGVVESDFSKPGEDDDNVNNLMGSEEGDGENEEEDDGEAERLKAEEEAKKAAKSKADAIARKKQAAAKRNAAAKK